MPDASGEKRDFFISFNKADRAWATWIAWTLEEAGYTVLFQDWDFKGNFVSEMDRAHQQTHRTIAVLSPDYLTSKFTRPEWAARFAEDATSEHDLLIPVLVQPAQIQGLLKQIIHVDLVGTTREQARELLLNRVAGIRLKPKEEPFFPGAPLPAAMRSVPSEPKFPITSKPRNLPYASLGSLFKGRESFMKELHTALSGTEDGRATAVIGKALHGLGGIGKTRLAVEYAWRHEAEYSALLFVSAETPERLSTGLAALAGSDVLDLPQKDAHEDTVRISAVLTWLEQHPGWLLILDNVDDPQAAAAVERLLARLRGGHVLITSRVSNFSAAVETLALDVLKLEDATAFLLERTRGKRVLTGNDETQARQLADELGGLALGLEQAGAYIATRRIGFAHYLILWRESREKVLGWFDKALMSYHHDVGLAATWSTSVERLTPAGRLLLERLAFLASDPIPDRLLEVPAPGDEGEIDPREALADLYAYSLASPAEATDGQATGPAFMVHRLVQDFTRRGLGKTRERAVLEQALGWVNAAFVGKPGDVRDWPVLDPLAPHALTVAERSDEAGIPEPTARLMNELGLLFYTKARYREAEPLYRRALKIDEASLGPDHPDVATCLSNLATLLQATNRLPEAEPLYRRALAIRKASLGPDHPNVAIDLNNLAALLQATSRLPEAEPLYRRALAISEASLGPDHPNVATYLNNLAELLRHTSRPDEAEPLYRRALEIDEASLGPDHPNVATRLNNLARLLQATNRPAEAEPLFRRALSILMDFEHRTGHPHPNRNTGLENYRFLLAELGRSEEEIRSAITAITGEVI